MLQKDTSSQSEKLSPNQPQHPLIQQCSGNQLRPIEYNFVDSFACTYIISVLGAFCAEFTTYPLDLTKTRLQIQGEAAAKLDKHLPYRGMLATAFGIVREEGLHKLWQGMPPALCRHVIYSGVRVCLYDYLRRLDSKVGKTNEASVWKSAVYGVTAGCVGQYLASPADLVKVQIQMEGKRRLLGLEPRVHSTAHAFRDIYQRGGIRGLWKGSIPNVQRAAFINLGDLTTYDVAKQFVMNKTDLPDCRTVHVIASVAAGFVAAIMGTPADVIKARVMNQPTDANGRGLLYKGSIDCLSQTVRKEGFFALYKGFLPCWIRLGPWALTFWLSFEQMRSLIGASGY